jgi:hypothetical protein
VIVILPVKAPAWFVAVEADTWKVFVPPVGLWTADGTCNHAPPLSVDAEMEYVAVVPLGMVRETVWGAAAVPPNWYWNAREPGETITAGAGAMTSVMLFVTV